MTHWTAHAARLADELTQSGKLWSAPWQAAVRAVPRHELGLLSHQLGGQHVFSVDIEPTLIQLARQRLAKIGYHPTLVIADGANGLPDHAPYDRIIATCSVPAVPGSWVEQTREEGLILADVTPAQPRRRPLSQKCPQRHPAVGASRAVVSRALPATPGVSFGLCGDPSRPPTTTFLSAADGSWCEIDEPSSDGTSQRDAASAGHA